MEGLLRIVLNSAIRESGAHDIRCLMTLCYNGTGYLSMNLVLQESESRPAERPSARGAQLEMVYAAVMDIIRALCFIVDSRIFCPPESHAAAAILSG